MRSLRIRYAVATNSQMRSLRIRKCESEANGKQEVGSRKRENGSWKEHRGTHRGDLPQWSSMALLPSIIEECIEGTGRSGARWRCSTGIHHHRETISRQQCTRTPVLKANRHTMGARIPTYAHHGRMNPDVCTPWENESRRVHISRPGEERL
jgi:hypothetical protein